jgi:hypothetical protein
MMPRLCLPVTMEAHRNQVMDQILSEIRYFKWNVMELFHRSKQFTPKINQKYVIT